MLVHVQCPHCSSLCQVEDQYLGAALKCGRCGQTFTIRPTPQPAAPGPGGLAARLRGMFRSLLPSARAASPPPPVGVEAEPDPFLDLDGPGITGAAGPDPSPETHTAPSAAPSFRLEIGGATSVGRVRSRNEDSFLIQQLSWSHQDRRHDLALIVVADGMGGYAAGDRASGLLIQSVSATLTPLLQAALDGRDSPPPDLAETVKGAIQTANQTILQAAQADLACRGMGATVAVVLIWDGQVTIGHVGDCRVYHHAAGKLTQVTRDQTLVARLVEMGHMSPEEARTHPARNEVLQAVGRHPEVAPADYRLELKAGEWLVVACDGLHAHVDAAALEQAIRETPSPARLANRLVEMADQGGGTDNCTVVAVRCY